MTKKPSFRDKTVLVVDDEKFVRDLIRIKLGHIGISIIEADNGTAALEMAETQKPDLILLDVMMPRMNGFDACQKIRANPKTSSIPIVMLTARGEEENMKKGLLAGATDYVFKPFSPQKLADKVAEILSGG